MTRPWFEHGRERTMTASRFPKDRIDSSSSIRNTLEHTVKCSHQRLSTGPNVRASRSARKANSTLYRKNRQVLHTNTVFTVDAFVCTGRNSSLFVAFFVFSKCRRKAKKTPLDQRSRLLDSKQLDSAVGWESQLLREDSKSFFQASPSASLEPLLQQRTTLEERKAP